MFIRSPCINNENLRKCLEFGDLKLFRESAKKVIFLMDVPLGGGGWGERL